MLTIKQIVMDITGNTKKGKKFFLFTLFFILILCLLMMVLIWNQNIKQMRDEAIRLASVAEASLSGNNVAVLSATPEDLGKKEYQELRVNLSKIAKAQENLRFAYLYTVRENKIFIMADSEPATSEDYSYPGQEYTEGSEIFKQAFYDGQPNIARVKDRWGKWVSVIIPVKNPKTGKVIAVFGVDYDQKLWDKKIAMHLSQAGFISLCIIVIYIGILMLLRRSIILKREQIKLAKANEELSEQKELFKTVFEQSPMGIAISSRNGFIDHNPMYEKIVGRTREEIEKIGWENFTHPDDLNEELIHYEKFRNSIEESYRMNKRYIKPDGTVVWVNITLAPLKVEGKSDLDHICMVEDITERVKAETDLRESERSHLVLLSNLPGMAYRCKYDKEWTMQFVSDGCYELTGYLPGSLVNNKKISYNDLITEKYRAQLWEAWQNIIKDGKKLSVEYEIKTAQGVNKWVYEKGQPIFDEKGNVIALEGLIIDITDRKEKEDEILFLNNHDSMTELYNRRYFDQAKLKIDEDKNLPVSVIMGDINGVKLVNDALGHSEGDILIVETAKLLKRCTRETDLLARTGGDEFAILLPKTDEEEANKLLACVKEECELYNKNLHNDAHTINISLGLATKYYPEEDLEMVIKTAEDHMYKRKLLEHKSSHSIIIASIKATMHEKSHETQEHADRLSSLSKEIGKKIKLNQQEIDELELVSTLHDIGKVGIDDSILNKEGSLTEEEWIEMKKHSEIGYRIAMSSPDLAGVADYILSLHERWDGKGYPQGIKGMEIPLISRIVSIVDAYDAMIEDRPYRKALSREYALLEIEKNAGTQFDPKLAKIFVEKVIGSQS